MAAINRESFVEEYRASVERISLPVAFGSVEVTLGGITKRVPAKKFDDSEQYLSGYICITGGVVAKYRTGSKVWQVSLSNMIKDGKEVESCSYGRDDRSSKFRKAVVGFSL